MAFDVRMTLTTATVVIASFFALSPRSNLAFVPIQPHSMVAKSARLTTKTTSSVPGRNLVLTARDTIFSLNDDDDDTNIETDADETIDSDNIEDIVTSMLADEKLEKEKQETMEKEKKKTGDSLRADNGVRPSIHPTTINAIAEALKARATQSLKKTKPEDEDEMMHFRVSDDVEPLMVMVTAGQFASDAIQQRQESNQDDEEMLLSQGEEQTLAGRVMGVIMRFDTLEEQLAERTSGVDWVAKYDEWGSFGVVEGEHTNDDESDRLAPVHAKILDDPLFCINRAECLLAIFLQEVEIPQLKKLNETVPDQSKIDFLDEDRREVLLDSD